MARLFRKSCFALLCIVLCCYNNVGCGTLGGISTVIFFPVSKKRLESAIDSLYTEYPDYKIPPKWTIYNDWSSRGYDFLESRIFYFASSPEEMYYVTFYGDKATLADTTKVGFGISAVNKGDYRWLLEKDLDSKEENRIEQRFKDEIVRKLERYTNSKASP
jgi:hypothetical protein